MNEGFSNADLHRKFHGLVIFGKVVEVDYPNKRLKLQEGEGDDSLTTGWLPFPAESGRNYKRWRPVKVGQQFTALCRGGDPVQGRIVGEQWYDANDSPSVDPDIDVIQFDNGNKIEHNAASGTITVIAQGNVVVKQGDVIVPDGDVIASGVSLVKHTHGKTTPGKGSTGKPN